MDFLNGSLLAAGASLIPTWAFSDNLLDPAYYSEKAVSRSAVDLLTMFTGKNAEEYEQYFCLDDESKIVSVEIHAVGTDSTDSMYSGEDEMWKQVNNCIPRE